MNNLIEKFKTLEMPHKLLIVGLIITICMLPLFMGGGDTDEEQNLDSLETPENRRDVEDYNSKLEAYGDDRAEGEQVSLEFDLDNFGEESVDEDTEKEKMEREIDSLMNQNKRTYDSPSRTNSNSGSTRRPTVNSTPRNSARPTNAQNRKEVDSQLNEFFSSTPSTNDAGQSQQTQTDPMIFAVIHGDHTIRQGERVKLRLTKPATIANMQFSANSYVYAFPRFRSNRVMLTITSINHVPVSISAYDTEDSSLGLYVEGAKLVGEIADESSQDAVDKVNVGNVPIGSTIKNVFRRKQQQPNVTLLNNTKLILKPNS
ncbi:MAG: conjugative transposon protein TraM [Bacteroidota bacterium]